MVWTYQKETKNVWCVWWWSDIRSPWHGALASCCHACMLLFFQQFFYFYFHASLCYPYFYLRIWYKIRSRLRLLWKFYEQNHHHQQQQWLHACEAKPRGITHYPQTAEAPRTSTRHSVYSVLFIHTLSAEYTMRRFLNISSATRCNISNQARDLSQTLYSKDHYWIQSLGWWHLMSLTHPVLFLPLPTISSFDSSTCIL